MDPKDFLSVAKNLLNNGRPADCRSAINRSYYAAYNVAVNLLENSGINILKSGAGHGEVGRYLGNCGIRELEEAQTKLTNLASLRIKADYRLNETAPEKSNNAKKAILTSESIMKKFDSQSSKTGRRKIANGINKYKQKISPAPKKIT